MNVTFTLDSPELLAEFLAAAGKAGIVGPLGGHRSVGGCRASLCNGVTQEMAGRLIDFMHGFERQNRRNRASRWQEELVNA